MSIQLLTPYVANQISAGEVIERPASVVKELMENAIDSGADSVDIYIEKGGHQRIAIYDNGMGISYDDLPMALARHATSKLALISDLDSLSSFGFRGEALASIAACSRLTLISRSALTDEAWQIKIRGDALNVKIEPLARSLGTTVQVDSLFFNIPARRKFLKSERTDFGHIDELIRRFVLSHPFLEIKLFHNTKLFRHYERISNLSLMNQRLLMVYGHQIKNCQYYFQREHQQIVLKGWLFFRHFQRDRPYLYINSRVVKNKIISHAVKQAFSDSLCDFSGSYLIFLTIPPDQIDINVHPSKFEVRFHQERLIHDLVYQTIVNSIQSYFSSITLPEILEDDLVDSPSLEKKYDDVAGICFSNDVAPLKMYSYDAVMNPFLNDYRFMSRVHDSDFLFEFESRFYLCSFDSLYAAEFPSVFRSLMQVSFLKKPLLIPCRFQLDGKMIRLLHEKTALLHALGFEWKLFDSDIILIRGGFTLNSTLIESFFKALLVHRMSFESIDFDFLRDSICLPAVFLDVELMACLALLDGTTLLRYSKLVRFDG